MNYIKILLFLTLFTFFSGCKKDEYKEFKKVPEYITHPDRAHKAYYEAYDKTLKKWGVAYEDLYITTSKGVAHVLMSGPRDGTPVVLLHGMSASSTMWYPNAKALAKHFRIFAIDLIIEPGKSNKTADFKNIEEVTAWYEEIFWALKLDSFHLIGTSRGGWIATDIALHSKRDIKSLILLSPVQTIMWIPPSTDLLKNIFNIFHSDKEAVERTMGTLSKNASKIDSDYMAQYRLGLKNDTEDKFLPQMKPFSNNELQSLKMPVLVLIGDDDMFNTKHTIHLTEKYIPRGRGEVISNSGHFLSVDQPEVVDKKMVDFMKNVEKAD
jgi:pimeloyl-ACP methyl ester carboxylesterase